MIRLAPLRRILLPLLGAAAFSSACVLGAVAPAMAAPAATGAR